MSDDSDTKQPSHSYSMSTSMGATGSMSASMGAAPSFAPAEKPAMSAGAVVKDITTQTFMVDVIEASQSAPVIVDFWAPWCGPCKQLGPVIERVVSEVAAAGGRVTLCKMDVEKYPEVSQQMGVQSIPAVVAFIDGRPADAFMGAKGEKEVRAFVEKVAKKGPPAEAGGMDEALDQANQLFTEGEYGDAAELYSGILAQEPGNLDAYAGLGQCYVAVGEADTAQKLIDKVPEEHRNEGPLAALQKQIDLAMQAQGLGALSELLAKVEANEKDYQARFDYAIALSAEGEREAAAEQLVTIVRLDRKWKDDGARTQLLEFFEAWGNSDPATLTGRRALSSVLFS